VSPFVPAHRRRKRLTFLVARVKRVLGRKLIVSALRPLRAIRFSSRPSPSSYAASDTSSLASPSALLFVLYQIFTHTLWACLEISCFSGAVVR